ncbi:hypothetical protein CHRYSEOSP005_26060 [Chryseobacterium sp. Alg-005]|uniref:RNA polymerase sigma factor n=1 Tax=Chryseobacterium sp. Alg-005 TaxID=3159516 RepID=UPI003555AB70
MRQSHHTDWKQIYNEYSPKLLGICRRYIQDIQTAEDIVQDSFIMAIQNSHQLREEKAVHAWLKKIVVNNALQYLRKSHKEIFVSSESSEIPDTYSDMSYPSLEEKHIFIYDFTKEELLSSIDCLPSHHRSVFNLYFIENCSHAEISGLLGISVNTSKSHLSRAKKAIQSFLMSSVNANTPKNKLAQLLVVFGLGGLLWAQTFRSKFADFRISPSKSLEIPDNIKMNSIIVPSFSGQILKKKIIISGTVLLIIIASVFLLKTHNNHSFNNHDNVTYKPDVVSEKENLNSENNVSQQSETGLTVSDKANEKETKSQNNITDTKENTEPQQSPKTIQKDSAKHSSKKVIIVKKIIQRDTVFVER